MMTRIPLSGAPVVKAPPVRRFRAFIIILSAAALSACAGRPPQPVALVQVTDQYMDCAAISIEAQANNAKIQYLGAEEGNKAGQNVAAGVVGLFIWPLWFAMDFQDAAGK